MYLFVVPATIAALIFSFPFKDRILLLNRALSKVVLISKFVRQSSLGMKGSCLVVHKEIPIEDQCAMFLFVKANTWSKDYSGSNQRMICPSTHSHRHN